MLYRCHVCGEEHDNLPHIGADFPDPWYDLNEVERDACFQTPDTCVIGLDHFIRGVIEIPIRESPQSFGFGVWVTQKKENFVTYLANFDTEEIGPFFGWLSTRVAFYEDNSFGLKTMAHFIGNGQRPKIVLEPTLHPLAVAQKEGITLADAWDIVHFYTDDAPAGE